MLKKAGIPFSYGRAVHGPSSGGGRACGAYRGLERLAEDGEVMKLPSEDGSRIRYCYADKEELGKPGKLVCLRCGRFIPLECSRLDDLFRHICEEHGFELDKRHMVLYGYCGCRKDE